MKNTLLFTLILTMLCLQACQDSKPVYNETTTSEASTTIYKRVSTPEFKKLMADLPDAQLVDVRTATEYKGGHIRLAENIDYKGADFKTKIANLDKSKPVLVYCQAGGRSQKACGMMQDMGFKEIYELKSGYGKWE